MRNYMAILAGEKLSGKARVGCEHNGNTDLADLADLHG
jgi:hypothetical protein